MQWGGISIVETALCSMKLKFLCNNAGFARDAFAFLPRRSIVHIKQGFRADRSPAAFLDVALGPESQKQHPAVAGCIGLLP